MLLISFSYIISFSYNIFFLLHFFSRNILNYGLFQILPYKTTVLLCFLCLLFVVLLHSSLSFAIFTSDFQSDTGFKLIPYYFIEFSDLNEDLNLRRLTEVVLAPKDAEIVSAGGLARGSVLLTAGKILGRPIPFSTL